MQRARRRLVARLCDRMRYAGNDVRCPCCEGRFGRFRDAPHGPVCPRCGSDPAQRLLWLFLNSERLLATPGVRVLQLSPAACIEQRMRGLAGIHYVTVGTDGDVLAHASALPFPDSSFDRVLSGPVPGGRRALGELTRILSSDGVAVIQDHGDDSHQATLEEAGFRVRLIAYAEQMDEHAARRNGVTPSAGGVYLCRLPR